MEELFNIKDLLGKKFEDLEKQVFRYVCEIGRQLTQFMLEQLDEYIMKNRDRKRYASKQIRKTTIKTVYGEVEYNRRMYFDRNMDEYVYLLDDKIQMQKVGTISVNLAKKIAETTINMPFRKAAESISKTTGQTISSHGIWNVVQQIGDVIQTEEKNLVNELKTEQTRGTKESKIIFMESDGVYLKIQKNKQKAPSMEIKVATVYDGWSEDGTKLHNKIVFAGMESAKKFNEKTEALVQSVFDIDAAELRVLNGDGAGWIKNTYDPDRVFQLDRFHIKKEIRRCIPEINIRKLILKSFEDNRMDEMLSIIHTYINSIDDGSNEERLTRATSLYSYLSNNYDGLLPWKLQAVKVPEAPNGMIYKNMGVQENQNCSLICIRMDGRKMRWSVAGANNLAKLIYTHENGNLDKMIENAEGKIDIPSACNIVYNKTISSNKVNKIVGSGNKWIKSIQGGLPLIKNANSSLVKLIRQISF